MAQPGASSERRHDYRSLLTLACCSLVALELLFVTSQLAQAVVVDGKRGGPSALKNQSHESEMIDGYNTKTCGISDVDKDKSDSVNAARPGQFPWLTSFQVRKPNGKTAHFCMGSFISRTWILSAAHCFADPLLKPHLDKNNVLITAGSTNAYGANNANFTIKRIFYHSRFDRKSPIGFDVALVEVNEPAEITTARNGDKAFINTVCLPIQGKEFKEGQAVKLAGWGDTESKDPKSKPDNLLTTDLILTNGEKCASIFSTKMKKVKNQFHQYKDFICADYKGQRDACQGKYTRELTCRSDAHLHFVSIIH
jgi:secreted trypsin-like serine protease